MCFFSRLVNIPSYICTTVYPSVDGHLDCFHVPAIVNRAAINVELHVSLSILVSLGYMPSSGIAGSYAGFYS